MVIKEFSASLLKFSHAVRAGPNSHIQINNYSKQ